MKLQTLLQEFDFREMFPEMARMYPKAREKKYIFEKAYNEMITMPATDSKKYITYQLMTDPDSGEMFVGADDHCFNTTWDVCLGKEVRKDGGAEISRIEIAANCLLNLVLISRHPKDFDDFYKELTGRRQ